MKKIISILVLSLMSIGLFAQDYKLLDITGADQERCYWCWNACTQMILDYYDISFSQCEIAEIARQIDSINFAPSVSNHFGSIPCCSTTNYNTWGYCNKSNHLGSCSLCSPAQGRAGVADILNQLGIGSSVINTSLTFSEIMQELNARNPIIIRWEWNDGSGHFIIGKGFDKRSGDNYIYTYDPLGSFASYAAGDKISLYDWVVSGSSPIPTHAWTHTLTLSTNPPCGKSESSFTSPIQTNVSYSETESVIIKSVIENNSSVGITFGKECILDSGFEVKLGSSITIQTNSSLICN